MAKLCSKVPPKSGKSIRELSRYKIIFSLAQELFVETYQNPW